MLCGEIHPVRIHAVVVRKVRNRDGENVEIRIFSIVCQAAKERGSQYTKRILPPFVIPECNITVENVLEYLRTHPGERIDYERASMSLGAIDNRTIVRHLRLCRRMVGRGCLCLCETLASLPSYATVGDARMGTPALDYLEVLVEEADEAARRMGRGAVVLGADPIWYVHAVYRYEKSRSEPAVSLDRVFWALQFFDTS